MKVSNKILARRTRWSDCQQVSELALLIDAMPPDVRGEVVRLAITFQASTDFEQGYIVGEVRSLVVDSVAQLFGHSAAVKFEHATSPVPALDEMLARFCFCGDPATVQLIVCDLIEAIAAAGTVE